METINQRLIRLRKEKGLTMRQVAEDIQVPLSTYRDWEYGRSIHGTPYVKLASLFEISLYELFTGEKPKHFQILALIEGAEEKLRAAKKEMSPLL
jgi:transcriptional regulator with XRE-family HTH domain